MSAFTAPLPLSTHALSTRALPIFLLSASPPRAPPPHRLRSRRLHLCLPAPSDLLSALQTPSQPRQILAIISLSRLPPLEAATLLHISGVLRSPNPQIRVTALATLGKLHLPREAPVLLTALRDDKDHSVRAAAANGLANIPFSPRDRVGDNVTRGLIDATSDSHFIVRYAAIVAMGCLSDDTFLHTLQDIATNVAAPALEAAAAIRALGEIVEPNHVSQQLLSIVTKRAADRDDFIRAAVARTLGRWIGVANVQLLLDKMKLDEVKYGQSVMVNTILDNVSKGHLD